MSLRVVNLVVQSSISIQIEFTEEVEYSISLKDQFFITPQNTNLPTPKVLSVLVSDNFVELTIQPLTPYEKYKLTFDVELISINGNAILNSDENSYFFLGYEDLSEPIRTNLLRYLEKNIYDLDNPFIRNLISSQSKILSQFLFDVKELKNDNYLDLLIENEPKTRGVGPYDRLNEGGAYKILRVGKNLPGETFDETRSFEEFPNFPAHLQSVTVEEEFSFGNSDGTFKNLILTTSKQKILKVNSVKIIYSNSFEYIYSIENFGYQLADNTFDQDFARRSNLIESNQIKLNDEFLKETDQPILGDKIIVSFDYQNFGKIINETSVEVFQIFNSVREVAPPISTYFTLKFAPILDLTGNVAVSNGTSFLNPYAEPPFSTVHPAFKSEKPFDLNALPASAGEYAIDYLTGKVFVYGEEEANGTGEYPPVCTYSYKKSLIADLDYTYDPNTYQIVASSLFSRNLEDQPASISFSYENTLVDGIDFVAQIHKEIINERVENRVKASNAITVKNSPITNVFRIFNETSGEVYTPTRWNDSTVFFTSNFAPKIIKVTNERVKFAEILNEVLFFEKITINTLGFTILEFYLKNNHVMSSTEDLIGSSFNGSLLFSKKEEFETERYFDWQTDTAESFKNELLPNQYFVDYNNGIIYLAAESDSLIDYGTVNYKYGALKPNNIHLFGVYNFANSNRQININSFNDTEIIPSEYQFSDERFTNNDPLNSYIVDNQTITLSENAFEIRSVYDLFDLKNNLVPINFAIGSTIDSNVIALEPITHTFESIINADLSVLINQPFLGVDLFEVLNVFDENNVDYWDDSGTFSDFTLQLSGTNAPETGTLVRVVVKLILNGSTTPIIDYSRGDYVIDYTYLADEILISYEYGNNLLDFRQGTSLEVDDSYFVTYRVGALRQALLKNFGSIFNIPLLNHEDLELDRESYRDALMAAMGTVTKGPKVSALKNLVKTVVHVEPEIIESAFELWSLGTSYLFPSEINVSGEPGLIKGRFDLGLLIDKPNQSVSLSAVNSFKFEEGTLELWIAPKWNGLDNDANLTFSLLKDGYELSEDSVWVGSSSFNPIIKDGIFSLNKTNDVDGLPSAIFTKTGIFIYFDSEANRWKILAKESENISSIFSGTIQSSGEVYSVKFLPGLAEINDILKSGKSTIEFEFNLDALDFSYPDGYVDGYHPNDGYDGYVDGYDGYVDGYGSGNILGYSFDGIEFLADANHYFVDIGHNQKTNRFSLFKDGSGYLVFRIFDKFGNRNEISTNISDWEIDKNHHVALSWKLNSFDKRDEMHLFIDGEEVPNVMKFGGRPVLVAGDKYRTVKPEVILASATQPTIADQDLKTTVGSNVVYSPNHNFTSEGIVVGNVLQIREINFSTYIITNVDGHYLTIDETLNATLLNALYSINPFSTIISSHIGLYTNIAVYILRDEEEIELSGVRANIPSYELSKNALSQDILTIYGGILTNDQVSLKTLGLNHRRIRERKYLWSPSAVLKTNLPEPVGLDEVQITSILLPLITIGPNSATNVNPNWIQIISLTQPSNNSEGRTLQIKLNGSNFTSVDVVINGLLDDANTSETLSFTTTAVKTTVGKFLSTTTININVVPKTNLKDFFSIEVSEAFPITVSEGNVDYPIISYSYPFQNGETLEGSGTNISDENAFFNDSIVNQFIIISEPLSVAGTYKIIEKINSTTLKIGEALTTFANGIYQIYYISPGRTAFQNGSFTLQNVNDVSPFVLPLGTYAFDYSSYLTIPLDPLQTEKFFIGSDMEEKFPSNAVIDEVAVYSQQLTDVRVGETLATQSITKDFQKINPTKPNSHTLSLFHFDEIPIVNEAKFYVASERDFLQSSNSVNENFEQAFMATSKPIILENIGILPQDKGSIEFWVSPKYDTVNDPKDRYYFDATSVFEEKIVSLTKTTIQLSQRAFKIFGVFLQSDTQEIGKNYFENGELLPDGKTIKLGQSLPSQKTLVKVVYVQLGFNGDRMSIYKDVNGFLNFYLSAGGKEFRALCPIVWGRNTWHRVVVTYSCNSITNKDELQLIVDGEQAGAITFGSGFFFGSGIIFGQSGGNTSTTIKGDINFKDPINYIYIGSDFKSIHLAQAKIDNLRISNSIRRLWKIGGQTKDLNYSSNTSIVLPVVEDLYTTYLLNFNSMITKNTDFAILRDEEFGIFNFTMNIIDSFDIVSGSIKIKQILESLIKVFKPAYSKVKINYLK